jgi:imidazolonepropionase-like amidohydrolase
MAAEGDGDADDGEAEPAVALEELREAVAIYQGPVRGMGTFAITNAQVWTVSGETIEGGTVVVSDGKIQAVGRGVSIPAGAEIIDAQGGALIPGIIDAHSHIAIEGGVNEGSLAVTSMVRIRDVINPDDVNIYQALAGGVTAANLLHGSANPIGGQNAVIKLRWGSDAEGLIFEGAPEGIKFALGENPKRSNFRSFGIPQRYPQTRMGVMDVIRQAFTRAQEYQKEWAAYEASGGAYPPRRDLELEALVEILEGERLVHSHCYRADEILQLMRTAEDFGWQVATLQHVLEGYKVADEIAAHGAGASAFSDWWGYKVEAYEAIPHAAALMAERGVLVSINSDSGEEMRHLNQEAAKAIKWGGMDPVAALALVTLNPAKQLRVDDRVGSIEVGKDADLVLYDGDPLSMMSVVQKTFVDGDLYFDREADRQRQAKVDEIKTRLSGKDKGEGDESEEGGTPPPEVHWGEAHTYSCREVG